MPSGLKNTLPPVNIDSTSIELPAARSWTPLPNIMCVANFLRMVSTNPRHQVMVEVSPSTTPSRNSGRSNSTK